MEKKPTYQDLEQHIRTLEAEKEKYRTMVEKANDPIFIVQDGMVKYANPSAMAMAGINQEHLGKQHYTEYLHPEERDMVKERHEKRLRGDVLPNVYPIRIKNRQGEIFWAELNSVKVQWEDKPATLNVIRDITSQKLFEEHAFQTESLEALRTLAGGLAHGLNNLLMGIQGRASLLYYLAGSNEDANNHIKGIEACVREASGLTDQMVGFAQTGKYQVSPVCINEIVEEVIKSFKRSDRSIILHTTYDPLLWRVAADRRQIELAIMNVILNAWQAILHQGQVHIKTENYILSEDRHRKQDLQIDKCVKLSVRDTGVGMSQSVRKRVFEPFFTTKDMARHRGLGLSSVYGIIANHNGLIDIESEKKVGTTVTIFLPAT